MRHILNNLTPNATKNSTAARRNAKTHEHDRHDFRLNHPLREESASTTPGAVFGRTGGGGDTTHGLLALPAEECWLVPGNGVRPGVRSTGGGGPSAGLKKYASRLELSNEGGLILLSGRGMTI